MSLVRAKIGYMDDKELFVDLEEAQLEEFSKTISNQQVYWNIKQSQGFWTDISKIRYINFVRGEAQNEGQSQQVLPDSSEVRGQDEGSESLENALAEG